MIQIAVEKSDYEGRPGTIAGQRIISEYSIRADHSVSNSRLNARYLIEDNIREGLNVDLKKGQFASGTFIDTDIHLKNVPCLLSLIRWAVGQNGTTIKEVFGDADFASCRGTMRRIASTLTNPGEVWSFTALDIGGVILLSEQFVKYHGGGKDTGTYSGFKFEQYMTSSDPNGRPDQVDSPVDNRAKFELVVRSDLAVGDYSLKLCCVGELDALSRDEPIEIKCSKDIKWLFQSIPKMMQSDILGVRRIVVGIKKENHILRKVVEVRLEDFKDHGNNREKAAQCYSFLFSILSQIKNFLVYNDACRVTYDRNRRMVEIRGISKQAAKVDFGKDKGQFITEKLHKHFNNRVG